MHWSRHYAVSGTSSITSTTLPHSQRHGRPWRRPGSGSLLQWEQKWQEVAAAADGSQIRICPSPSDHSKPPLLLFAPHNSCPHPHFHTHTHTSTPRTPPSRPCHLGGGHRATKRSPPPPPPPPRIDNDERRTTNERTNERTNETAKQQRHNATMLVIVIKSALYPSLLLTHSRRHRITVQLLL